MPTRRSGKDKSQTTGNRISANSATGQHSTNNMHHPTKRIRAFIFLFFHFRVKRQPAPDNQGPAKELVFAVESFHVYLTLPDVVWGVYDGAFVPSLGAHLGNAPERGCVENRPQPWHSYRGLGKAGTARCLNVSAAGALTPHTAALLSHKSGPGARMRRSQGRSFLIRGLSPLAHGSCEPD